MKYAYAHLISENVAPFGATGIVVRNAAEKEVAHVPLGGLTQPAGTLRLRFIVASDPHIGAVRAEDFQTVLDFADNDKDCAFTAVCGDLVNNGGVASQRSAYFSMIGAAAKPVYSIAGNHDTIWGYPTDEHMRSYTGLPLYYAVGHADDEGNRIFSDASVPADCLLIFLGFYRADLSGGNGDWRGGEQFSADELAWFETVMAENTDKLRIVFMHPHIPDGAGDPPLSITPPNRPPDIWTKDPSVSTNAGADFLAILSRYPGALVFNGHSHYRLRIQEEQSHAVIHRPADGSYTSIHVPSPTKLRDVVNGQRKDLTTSDADYGGEGFVVDVYPDCIHLRGYDFVRGKWVGIGTYRIEVTV